MKVTASLTEKRSYHNAMIDGEAPEMLDPQDNIGSDIGPGDAIKAGLASLQGQAAAGEPCQLCRRRRGALLFRYERSVSAAQRARSPWRLAGKNSTECRDRRRR